jgi:hypothetical protein
MSGGRGGENQGLRLNLPFPPGFHPANPPPPAAKPAEPQAPIPRPQTAACEVCPMPLPPASLREPLGKGPEQTGTDPHDSVPVTNGYRHARNGYRHVLNCLGWVRHVPPVPLLRVHHEDKRSCVRFGVRLCVPA